MKAASTLYMWIHLEAKCSSIWLFIALISKSKIDVIGSYQNPALNEHRRSYITIGDL